MMRLYRIVFYAFFAWLQLLIIGINIAPASIGLRYLALNAGTSCPVQTFFIVYAVCSLLSSVCEVFALYNIQKQEQHRQFSELEDEDSTTQEPAAPEPDQRLLSSVVILLVILSSVFKWTCAIMALRLSMKWDKDEYNQHHCAKGTAETVQLFGYISFFQTVSGFVVLVICARCVCMCCGPQTAPTTEDDSSPPVAPVKDIEMCGTPVASVILWVKDGTVPPQFRCSLSSQVMKDPVVAADGYSYEREVIAARLKAGTDRLADGRALSPVTGRPLRHLELIPNHSLRSWIAEWQAREAVKDAAAAAAAGGKDSPSQGSPGVDKQQRDDAEVEKKRKTKPFGSPCSSGIKSGEAIAVTYDADDITSDTAPSSSQFGSPAVTSRSGRLAFLTRSHSSISGDPLRSSLTSTASSVTDTGAMTPTPACLHTSSSTTSLHRANSSHSIDGSPSGSSRTSRLFPRSTSSRSLSRSGSVASGLAAAVATALAAASPSSFKYRSPVNTLCTTGSGAASRDASGHAVQQQDVRALSQSLPCRPLVPCRPEEDDNISDAAESPLPVVQVVVEGSPNQVLYFLPDEEDSSPRAQHSA